MATLKAMFRLFDGYSSTIDKIDRKTDEATNKILKASGATDNFNNKLEATGAGANVLSGGINKLIGKFIGLMAIQKGINIVDEFTNTSARLNLINDGLQTQAELQEKIFDAANRSRGAYSDMASAVAKLQMLAGDSFNSNDETIAFTELLQKGFKVGGASQSEQSAAMLQLTQAMASGRLQGDEFTSISESAPLILQAISKYTGKSKGELKELSSEGLITSDIIKNAMFMAADDINSKFETMPMTFADVGNRIKNEALQAFSTIITAVNNLINTDGFMDAINGIIIGINLISTVIGGLINFIADNWQIIQSILIATGIYLLATLGPAFVTAGWLGLKAGMDIAAGWIMTNLPMLAIIATIAGIIYMLQSMGVTFEDIFSFVGGIVGAAVGIIINLVVMLWNAFAEFINFIGNAFNHPLLGIQIMFSEWTNAILGFILEIARGIENLVNKIPGVEIDITSGITGLKDNLEKDIAGLKTKADWQEYVKKAEFVDLAAAATTGSNIGKDIYGGLEGALSGLTDSLTGKDKDKGFNPDDYKTSPITVQGTGSNNKVEVDMSDEDLKYMRDIAERDYINKFSTATLAPNITVTFGDVHETADAEAVAGRIQKILQEEISTASEGVYDV